MRKKINGKMNSKQNRNILIFSIFIFCLVIFGVIVYKKTQKVNYDGIIPYGYNLFSSGVTRVKKDNKVGLIDKNFKEILKPQYQAIGTFINNKVVAKKNGKFGLIDKKGKIIIAFIYDKLFYFKNICIATKNNKVGMINLYSEEILPFQYDKIERFNTNKVKLFANGKIGLATLDGDIIVHTRINDKLEELSSSNNLKVKIKNNWYIRSLDTGNIISQGYKVLYNISEHLFVYSEDKKHFGILDKNGIELTNSIFDKISRFYINDYRTKLYPLKVKKDGKYGLYNAFGKEILKPIYDEIKELDLLDGDDFIIVTKNKKQGLLNKKGRLVLDTKYDEIKVFQYRSIAAKLDNKWQVFNENGKLKYDYKIDDFHKSFDKRDMALIKQNKTWKTIDFKSGKVLIKLPYEYAKSTHILKKYIYIKQNGKTGLINLNAKLLIEPLYDKLYVGNNKIIASKDAKKGFLDMKGDITLAFEYDNIYIINDEIIFVKKDNFWKIKNIKTKEELSNIKFKSFKVLEYSGVFNSIKPKKIEFIEVWDKDSKNAIISAKGELIIPFGIHRIEKKDDMFLVFDEKSAKSGFYDLKGNNIVPVEYDDIYPFSGLYDDGYMVLQKNKKWWIKNRKTLKTLFSNE